MGEIRTQEPYKNKDDDDYVHLHIIHVFSISST
jgi:hypothetical protein